LTRAGCREALERAPWLLPVVWAVGRGVPCDHTVLADELGVPARLARSLVYYARRWGLCGGCPGVEVYRKGREYAAVTPGYVLYAVVRGRKVRGVALSRSGVEGREGRRLLERALLVLDEFSADELS